MAARWANGGRSISSQPGPPTISRGAGRNRRSSARTEESDTGSWAHNIPVNVVTLLENTMARSIPLILGALAGCLGERAGVINIAIEGQLLFGAFTAAIVTSAIGGIWLGLVSGALAGALVGAVLASFAIRYLVDQIVLGVVLNLLVLGLTGYLYDRLMVPNATTYNNASTFVPVAGLPAGLEQFAEWNPISALAAAARTQFGNPTAIPDGAAWPP